MFVWLTANTATIIIGAFILIAVIAAIRSVHKKAKGGGCAGCGCGKSGCPASSACYVKNKNY